MEIEIKPMNILVVDDDPQVLNVLKQILELNQHFVVTVDDGCKACEAIMEMKFDLVILDIIMPEKEGVETILEIRKKYPDQKIIAISGGGNTHPGINVARKYCLKIAKQFGADAVLPKPFRAEELINIINQVVEQ